ncbi:MAG: hypothetical protein C0426_06985, partial [Rhodobacter sp.]|nr:hypothetical protein [Rhodobacter sp.]
MKRDRYDEGAAILAAIASKSVALSHALLSAAPGVVTLHLRHGTVRRGDEAEQGVGDQRLA